MRPLFSILLLALVATAHAQETLSLSALPPPGEQAALLWARAPRLQAARAHLSDARAEVDRAHLLPNPGLDLSWNTIPIGETNPPALANPLANVPNYAISLSTLIELGKRGLRQQAAAQGYLSAQADTQAALVDAWVELQQRIGEVAAAQLRSTALEQLAQDGHRLTELQRLRAEHGDIASLDVDRAVLEEESLHTSLAEEQAKLQAALRACGALVGVSCAPFETSEHAAAFLARMPEGSTRVEERPDLRALAAQEAAARHQVDLGHAKAIPDPTVRVGYVRDQFLISGNQGNSLFVGASLPLPLFDHGQADVHAASGQASAAHLTRELLLAQAARRLDQLAHEREQLSARRRRIREQSIPLARSLVTRLEELVQRGATPLPELLLARHTLGSLTLEAVDLDLAAQALALESARASGTTLPFPPELSTPP